MAPGEAPASAAGNQPGGAPGEHGTDGGAGTDRQADNAGAVREGTAGAEDDGGGGGEEGEVEHEILWAPTEQIRQSIVDMRHKARVPPPSPPQDFSELC